ncbi:DUF2690 domain-containing protein [Streptomyces sp. NPDC101152]|uniref:DUF2690 domain-containing protein n=1 Tax=Streptomyces sp. NPDC101152 TaxID=3366116 RepID=UPI003818A8FB
MSNTSRRVLGVLLSGIALAGVIPAVASAAPAAPDPAACYNKPSQSTCRNIDPVDSKCKKDAYVAKHAELNIYGTMQNWYSPHCRTNWAQFVPNGNVPKDGTANISLRVCLHNSNICSDEYSIFRTSRSQPPWSNMVYADTAVATAWFTVSDTPYGWGVQDSVSV